MRPAAPAATRPASTPTTRQSAGDQVGGGGEPGGAEPDHAGIGPDVAVQRRQAGPFGDLGCVVPPDGVYRHQLRQRVLAFAEHDDAAVRDVVPRGVQLRVDADVRALGHDDVLVQDRPAHHRAPADLDALHQHRALHVRAGMQPHVR